MHHNIQHLFAAISIGNIRRYLADRGWQSRPADGGPRLHFERTFAGGEPAATLWSWSSPENPRFRNQVPNIIFKLSVLEGRPALDIANEMYSSVAADEAAAGEVNATRSTGEATLPTTVGKAGAVATLQRVVLRVVQDSSITLVSDMPADVVHVAAGEVVEIVQHPQAGDDLELEIAGNLIHASAAPSAGLRLLQGVAHPSVGQNWSAAKIVCEESRRLEDVGDSKGAARLLEELGSTPARIDFELDVNARIDAQQQAVLLRQTALLAAALAKRLPDEDPARQLIWWSCAKLLYPVGLRLELRSTSRDELYDTAVEDDESSPKQTLQWLKENTASVV